MNPNNNDETDPVSEVSDECLFSEDTDGMVSVNQDSKDNLASKLFGTFTKVWVCLLLTFGLIDLQLSYILAFIGREQIAETLSVAVVTEIIGVSAVYMIRAYLDTKSEKAMELETRKFEYENEEYYSEESEGDE